jgi:hypothetical protein
LRRFEQFRRKTEIISAQLLNARSVGRRVLFRHEYGEIEASTPHEPTPRGENSETEGLIMWNLNEQASEARRQQLLREADHARLVREVRQSRRDTDTQRVQPETHDQATRRELKREYAK